MSGSRVVRGRNICSRFGRRHGRRGTYKTLKDKADQDNAETTDGTHRRNQQENPESGPGSATNNKLQAEKTNQDQPENEVARDPGPNPTEA